MTLATWYPAFGVMAKAWLAPELTMVDGDGEMEPFVPAEDVMVNVLAANVAEIE